MQVLPIKYVDTHNHGDIMSFYTNDIDTLRQMVSQSFPQLYVKCLGVDCIWNNGLLLCVANPCYINWYNSNAFVTKRGWGSARYFVKQRESPWSSRRIYRRNDEWTKVIKVFCHENESKADFDKLNEALFIDASKANRYANILGPILNNIGNVLYVCVAITGAFC